MSFNNCSKTLLDNLPISELKKKLTDCNENFTYINWIKIHYKNFINSNSENLETSNSPIKIPNPLNLIKKQNSGKILKYENIQNPINFLNYKNSENYQNSNQIYIFIFSILIFLLCILFLNMISKYFSKISQNIDKKYSISLVISSLLFLVLNFSDDFCVLILNSKKENFFVFGLGYLLCNFLLITCPIFGFIVFFVEIDLKKFKVVFFKDICFIGIFFFLVYFFGFLEIPYFYLAFLLLSVYLIYFFYSILYFEQRFIIKNDLEDKELIKENGDNLKKENKDNLKKENEDNQIKEDIEENQKKEDIEENQKKEDIKNQKKEVNSKKEEKTTIKSEIWEINTNLPYKILYRIFITPIKLFFLLTIPYTQNPLTKSNFYYPLIFLTNLIPIFLCFEISAKNLLIIALISLLITITLYLSLKFEIIKKNIFLINIFFSILSVLSWMNLLTIFLLEVVYYLNFLFDHESSFLNVFLPAFVNCITDFFSILSIINIDNGILAFLSIFSYQVFCLYTGLFIILVFGSDFYFNIFDYFKGEYGFVLILFFFAIGSFLIHTVYGLVFQGKYFKYSFVFSVFYIFVAFYLSLII